MNPLGATAAAVLAIVVLALAAPALAACLEAGDADCCGLEDSACVCCSLGPRITLIEGIACQRDASGQPIGPETSFAPREAAPRDILHVPRSEPAR